MADEAASKGLTAAPPRLLRRCISPQEFQKIFFRQAAAGPVLLADCPTF